MYMKLNLFKRSTLCFLLMFLASIPISSQSIVKYCVVEGELPTKFSDSESPNSEGFAPEGQAKCGWSGTWDQVTKDCVGAPRNC